MRSTNFLRVLAGVSSLALAGGLSTAANAGSETFQDYVVLPKDPAIVVTDGTHLDSPPPYGAYDSTVDVTGVGQMTVDLLDGYIGLCTGTLINPRTVIFASHCVNDEAAEDYGVATGGLPISFGFSAYNLPGLRRWFGLDGGALYETDKAFNIYNVEQVWYDPRSLALGPDSNFLQADVALATLDTPAQGVPTWALLFSPLTEETHAIINGYGGRGEGEDGGNLGIDYRRRIAENMLSVLGSLDDLDTFLFGSPDGLPQNLYQLDFDNPDGVDDPHYGINGAGYDFDVFDGPALEREGITAGGDSGGPLIVDELFDKPVVVGVLSGGDRFFTDQPGSSYGTTSFYQPLYLFWESIVANNPYVYASALPGDSNWNSKYHWIQDMDPAYNIAVGGNLVNALPGFEEPGVTGDSPKFGKICFIDDCVDLADYSTPLPVGTPNSVYVPGGPGSTRFVPDNVTANPPAGIKARYYEVTLSQPGTTNLTDDKTIDRFNLGGSARLRIHQSGDLHVLGDYTQTGGTLLLDGFLKTGEAFLGAGIIQGSGVFDPTYLTNVSGLIAPGALDRPGVLTIIGDVVLSSGSATYFNIEKSRSDLLLVQGDAANPGIASLGGLAYFAPGAYGGPVFGKKYTIVQATGGVQNTFDATAWTGFGVLYPELTYNSNSVVATIKAGAFTDYLAKGGVSDVYSLAFAFGQAFDSLRTSNYADLANVYGSIDVMGVAQLASTFRNNSATLAGNLAVSDGRQDAFIRSLVADRLSLMGRPGTAGRIRLVGNDGGYGASNGGGGDIALSSASQLSFSQSYQPRDWAGATLPENVSGFLSIGYRRLNDTGAGSGGASDRSGTWHMAMGLEVALDEQNAVGSAFGQSRGDRSIGGSLARITTSHAAFYGNHQLGGGAYVGGQVSMAMSALDASSSAPITGAGFAFDSHALSYSGGVELGYNHQIGDLTLTPRSRLDYSSYAIHGFQDRQSQLGMAVDKVERAGLEWRTGLHLAGSANLDAAGTWKVQPEIEADYVKRMSGNDTRLDLRFLDAGALGVTIPVNLNDSQYGEVRGGVTLTDGQLSFGAAVETQLGQDYYQDNRGVVSVSYAF